MVALGVAIGGVALQHAAVFLEFVFVVSDQFFRRIIGQVFDGYDFEAEQAAGNIDVSAVLITVVAFLFPPRARDKPERPTSRMSASLST